MGSDGESDGQSEDDSDGESNGQSEDDSDGESANDDDDTGTAVVELIVNDSSKLIGAKQMLDVEDDIRQDISDVLGIPISSVRVLNVRSNGDGTLTVLVELFDSATLSAQQAADELEELEATNDPSLQGTLLENASVVVVRASRSSGDSSSASALSVLAGSFLLALCMV